MSNLQKFNQTLEDLSQEVEKLKDVSKAYRKLQEILQQFEENNKVLEQINQFQKKLLEKVSKTLAEIENSNKQNKAELVKLIDEKTDLIRKENKEFYKDLESTIKIKLDDNKSEIKKLIESERSQIKQIFEIEFAKNIKELKQVIEAENKTVKFSIWVIGGLTLILSLLAVIKLWT